MIDGIEFFHDTRDPSARFPFGAIAAGGSVRLSLTAVENYVQNEELSVSVHFEADTSLGHLSFDVPTEKHPALQKGRLETRFTADIDCFDAPGVYFYYFAITRRASLQFDAAVTSFYYGNNAEGSGGLGQTYTEQPASFQITVYEKNLSVPASFYSSVIYQIFPDRFCRSGKVDIFQCGRKNGNIRVYEDWYQIPYYEKEPNGDIVIWDFFGGDLYGVADQLDYIRGLGADTIYLNPIFEAASNHRYDTADYMTVDPILGGEAAFDFLMEACCTKNMSLILDGVFSHTGEDSIYFDKFGHYGGQGAYRNPDSAYRNWFRFRNGNDDDYECWWNCPALPNVEEMTPSYMDFIIRSEDSVIHKWLGKGVRGFRLDVADELPDAFISCLRKQLETYRDPERILIGEVWEDASKKISYGARRWYFTGRELHSVTNYVFRNSLIDFLTKPAGALSFWSSMLSLQENYPVHNFYSILNMTGSHDVPRLFTIFKDRCQGDEERAARLQMAFAAVMFLFPGIPVVYYGDEACLEGGRDPDNRRTYPWGRVRYPFVLDFFCRMGQLRRNQPVLQRGILKILTPMREDGGVQPSVLAFERRLQEGRDAFGESLSIDPEAGQCDSIVCLVNSEPDVKQISLGGLLPGISYVADTDGLVYTADDQGILKLPIENYCLLKRTLR